jgi:hypothetical protein
MSPAGWAIAIGLTVLIEGVLVWRFLRALDRGVIKIDPLFWIADTFGLDFTVSRDANPILYWGGVLSLVLFGIAVLTIFIAIVVANRQ